MTRRTFDRAALRRASLSVLVALVEDLAAMPPPPDRAAAQRRRRYLLAARAELAHRARTGEPTPSPHRGRRVSRAE